MLLTKYLKSKTLLPSYFIHCLRIEKLHGKDNRILFFCQVLFVVTVGIGIYIRFKGLGKWPLAVDEYLIAKSVRNILEYGVPKFSCGGYYVRGILYQYLAAPFLYFFSNDEFWLRAIPVVSNILAIFPLYLIGKRLFGKTGACLSVVFFSLSIWEIEFARFARMYAPFQAIFLWYLLFFFRVLVDKDKCSWKWLHILSFVSIFVYEGSIFLLLFNFIPVILNYRQKDKINLIFSVLLFIFGYIFLSIDFRHLGAALHLPMDVSIPVSSDSGRILFPQILLTTIQTGSIWAFLILVPVFLTIISSYKLIKDVNLNNLVRLCLCAITGISFFNLFGLLIIFAAVCYLLGIIQWNSLNKKVLILCCFVILFNFIFWFIFGLTTEEWHSFFKDIDGNSIKKLLVILFKYPDIFEQILYPWLRAIPQLAILSAGIICLGLPIALKKPCINKDQLVLVALILVCFMFLGILKTPYHNTRYSFFFYPAILLLVAGSITMWTTTIFKNYRFLNLLILLFGIIYMVSVEDFSVYHLKGIDSKEINYRLNYDRFRAVHYYLRKDCKTPAQIINYNLRDGDIVVSTDVTVDYYLKQLDYSYVDAKSGGFRGIVACGGTKHIWTNARLIYERETLWKLLDNSSVTVWLITRSMDAKYKNDTEKKINNRYDKYLFQKSLDGLINVYRIM